MKLLRYGLPGFEKPGLVDDSGRIRDLSGYADDIAGDALLPESLDRLQRLAAESLPMAPAGSRLGPCVGSVGKIVGTGLNYRDHAREAGAEVPAEPIIFMKATSAISGPNDDVLIPRGGRKTDWEVELGVVIGRAMSYVPAAEAPGHIAGFCVINDISDRSFQLEGTGQWVKGKSADTFAPIGPWLVTSDEIPDPHNLGIWLEVNERRYQDSNTGQMIAHVPDLISYVSRFMSLQPGDIIATGTPPGVGFGLKPPKYLAPGDVMKAGIDKLGVQQQTVKQSSERYV